MRRNVLTVSRIAVQHLSCNHQIEKNLLSKCLSQRTIANISNESKVSKMKFKTSRLYTQTKLTNCWSCHTPMDISTGGTKESFFCSSCGCLQEVNMNYVRMNDCRPTKTLWISLTNLQNYFSLFGIAEQFELNQSKLTKKFRDFQSVLHPDKFSNK